MPLRRRRTRWRGVAPLLAPGEKMSRREYDIWRDEHTWDPARDTELVVQDDLSPAEWLAPLLVPESFEVRMMVPQGFAAYARLFFPVVGADDEHIAWTEIARRNGKVAHTLMELDTVSQLPSGEIEDWYVYDGLPPEQFDALMPLLARHTASTSAWFLLWHGFGDLNERAFADKPTLHHSWRDYYLLRGALDAFTDFRHEQPSYWWPDDRAWCVVNDVDFVWSYVAGSEALIEEVLAAQVLDAYATKPENPAHWKMDTVNDPDGTVPRHEHTRTW